MSARSVHHPPDTNGGSEMCATLPTTLYAILFGQDDYEFFDSEAEASDAAMELNRELREGYEIGAEDPVRPIPIARIEIEPLDRAACSGCLTTAHELRSARDWSSKSSNPMGRLLSRQPSGNMNGAHLFGPHAARWGGRPHRRHRVPGYESSQTLKWKDRPHEC